MAHRLTQKHGSAITDAPASLPDRHRIANTGRVFPCAIKVGSHRFAFDAQFIPVSSGRTEEGAGGISPPYLASVRAKDFKPNFHASPNISQEQHDRA